MIAKVENITLLELPEISEELGRETTRKAKELGWTPTKAKFYYRRRVICKSKLNLVSSSVSFNYSMLPLLAFPIMQISQPSSFVFLSVSDERAME